MINFVNTGADEAILKSMSTDGCSEELIKAMNKQGLVQKDVTVQGKNGKTFTRKQWVKAGNVKGDKKVSVSTLPVYGDKITMKYNHQDDSFECSVSGKTLKGITKEASKLKSGDIIVIQNGMNNVAIGIVTSLKPAVMNHGSIHQSNGYDISCVVKGKDGKEMQYGTNVNYTDSSVSVITSGLTSNTNKPLNSQPAPQTAQVAQNTAGNGGQKLSKEDAKKKTQSYTSKIGKTEPERKAFMDKVKSQGIKWTESDNAGINWMRCCMAMNNHFANGGSFVDGSVSPKSSYTPLKTDTPEAIKSLYSKTKKTGRLNASFIYEKAKKEIDSGKKLSETTKTVLRKAVYQVSSDNAFQSLMDKYSTGIEKDIAFNYIGFYIKNNGFGTSKKVDSILGALEKKYQMSTQDIYDKCEKIYDEYTKLEFDNRVGIADNEFPDISKYLVSESERKYAPK